MDYVEIKRSELKIGEDYYVGPMRLKHTIVSILDNGDVLVSSPENATDGDYTVNLSAQSYFRVYNYGWDMNFYIEKPEPVKKLSLEKISKDRYVLVTPDREREVIIFVGEGEPHILLNEENWEFDGNWMYYKG